MPGPESFADIVDKLVTVRQDYHEKLKSIPQYEAFLLIESSTEKAAAALQGIEASTSSIAADVIDSLQYARNRFEQHMASMPEYRVLVAIDKVIKEVSQHLGLIAEDRAPSAEGPAGIDQPTESVTPLACADSTETNAPSIETITSDAEQMSEGEAGAAAKPVEADAPTLRVLEASAKSASVGAADHDADAAHDIVVLNAPAWEKSSHDASDEITARLAAQAASAAANDAADDLDVTDSELLLVTEREPADHEAA